MTDPLAEAAVKVREFASAVADLEERRAEIDAKISAALDIAVAHGFDRQGIRAAAQSLRLPPAARDEKARHRDLYIAAANAPRE